jgi:hypothetical protein
VAPNARPPAKALRRVIEVQSTIRTSPLLGFRYSDALDAICPLRDFHEERQRTQRLVEIGERLHAPPLFLIASAHYWIVGTFHAW